MMIVGHVDQLSKILILLVHEPLFEISFIEKFRNAKQILSAENQDNTGKRKGASEDTPSNGGNETPNLIPPYEGIALS